MHVLGLLGVTLRELAHPMVCGHGVRRYYNDNVQLTMESTMSRTHINLTELVDKPFIGVTQGMSGWFAVLYSADAEGEYEPEQTGIGRFATRDEAVEEAESWAEDEGIELRI
jgi:hypothetical protein